MAQNPHVHDPSVIVPEDPESIAFVQGLIDRGEAAVPNPDGSLPSKVTHVIVGRTKSGLPIVKRVRISMF